MGRDVQNAIVADGTFGTDVHVGQGLFIIVEFLHVKAFILLGADLIFVAPP
ncbi:hypothetical protein SDC9_175364 [bioreactor metagenome]|uniref:Uncharacterized protein n=1 Tax=bioreactor metagenome TaxID=1076179 RepID=A0A645GP04_9ZZZZ